jgi:hypothetical protein
MYAPIYSPSEKEHFRENDILNLILYHPSPHEDAMKKTLTDYLITIPSVKFYFITLRPQEEEIVIEDHVMYIKGTETYRPGILDKTIRGIQYAHENIPYKYLVRSNISTVIDFNRINESEMNGTYMGCDQNNLQWIDHYGGIFDTSLFGTRYIGGIGIIMTRETVDFLLQHKSEINMDVIDDVAIGAFFTKYPAFSLKTVAHTTYNTESSAICYRNRTHDRQEDVERMKRIIDKIKM